MNATLRSDVWAGDWFEFTPELDGLRNRLPEILNIRDRLPTRQSRPTRPPRPLP